MWRRHPRDQESKRKPPNNDLRRERDPAKERKEVQKKGKKMVLPK